MTDITDDTKTGTITLTEVEEPEVKKTSWLVLGAVLVGLYQILR